VNPLLAQFLTEAADLLAEVDEGLLRLEREPGNAELINEVFRAAHTIKGASGLFDFPELTRLTHAAEDLLDAVRTGRLPPNSAMADDLLAAFDLIRAWLAHVTTSERLPATAGADAADLITRLRAPLRELAGESAAPAADHRQAESASVAPGWLMSLGEQWLRETADWLITTSASLRFARYLPDGDCFFRAEDPVSRLEPPTGNETEMRRLLALCQAPTAAADAGPAPEPDRRVGPADRLAQPDDLPGDRGGRRVTDRAREQEQPPEQGPVGSRILKVDTDKVDRLMELAGELNVAKNALTFLANAAEQEFGSRELSRRIKDQYAGMHRIAEDLQAAVMDIRMLPFSVSFSRFPRLVRDLSRRLGKTIELVTDGEDTMADKDVIEALGDPLVHLVRNSLDHGIEAADDRVLAGKPAQAQIRLTAISDGDAVVVEVADDGRGIDPEKVKLKAYEKGLISEEQLDTIGESEAVDLVFRPGFSLAPELTDLSGRGVGMDAVRASVERMGGSVTLRSRLGAGTSARLRMPLSMAVTQVVVVSVAGQRFGVPVDLVIKTVGVAADEVGRILQQEVLVLRDEVLPIIDLAELLDLPRAPRTGGAYSVLIVQLGNQKVGLLVDGFDREVDVILKPMAGLLADVKTFSGTALLGDGLVLLILNLKEVLSRYEEPCCPTFP
jgi:chemotaxis protein histidine kinase CheA